MDGVRSMLKRVLMKRMLQVTNSVEMHFIAEGFRKAPFHLVKPQNLSLYGHFLEQFFSFLGQNNPRILLICWFSKLFITSII